ncbi:MAG: hypothetical protein JW780_05995 [Clostridiales bacterium]|nr:hypothetical protein [Clostridiales bacterium]
MTNIGKGNHEAKWHRLDNTANIFPVVANRNYSSIYRISVTLTEEIDPNFLQRALDETLPRFGSFNVRLRHGFFWYYFEANDRPCFISPEMPNPCSYFIPAQNNHHLFRVTYFRNRINLEVFHVVTDGAGAANFLKELVCRYIDLLLFEKKGIPVPDQPVVDVFSDIEDSYIKNFVGKDPKGYSTERAYDLRGEKLPIYTKGIIIGSTPIKEIVALCRSKGVTITQYLTAVMIWSIYREYLNGQPHRRPISISVPVNLRPYFDSTSTMNFFSVIAIVFPAQRDDHSFDEILEFVEKRFSELLTPDYFASKIAYNVSFVKKLYVRFIPLIIKNIFLKISYLRSAKANTITLSNIGRFKVPDRYMPFISGVGLLMGATSSESMKCSVMSYERTLYITFSSLLSDTYLQRAFFRKMADDGLKVTIETNGAYYENMR